MIAAILVRCSTNRQDYERQLKDLQRVADNFNYEIPNDLIFGEHITGKDDTTIRDRRSIRNLKKACDEKKMDVILVNEVSRLSRDPVSGRVYVRQFNNMGIPVYFRDRMKWTIDRETGRIDEGFEKELGNYFDGAAEYLKSMKTQTASGRRNRLLENQMVQGNPAFGYKKLGGSDKNIRNTVVVNEETAPIVVDIFVKYLEEGSTLKSTSLYISAKYGIRFSVGKTNHCLNYKGYATGNTTVLTKDPDRPAQEPEAFTITFEKILDLDTFEKAQKKLRGNRNSKTPRPTKLKVRLLSRLIRCPICGHAFSPRKRADGRKVLSWICMSSINNSAECNSEININDEKITSIIWKLVKGELIALTNLSEEQRNEKIEAEEEKIKSAVEELELCEKQIGNYQKIIDRAYDLSIHAADDDYEDAKLRFIRTKQENTKEIEYLKNKIAQFKQAINDSQDRISRFQKTDFAANYIQEIEADFNKQRNVILEYIHAIYPHKIAFGVLVLEVQTVDGVYNILFDAKQRNHKIAYYIHGQFARWQNGIFRYEAYDNGNYFMVTMPSLVMQSEEPEEALNFVEMKEVCKQNNWEIFY